MPTTDVLDCLMLAFEGHELPEPMRARLAARGAAGIGLFRYLNVDSPAQVRSLTDAIASLGPLLVAADQEGGQLLGLGDGTTPFAGNMALGAVGDAELGERVGAAIGSELRALGVTVDYAPVCDLAINPANPGLGVRSFGDDPAAVAPLVAATVRGIQSVGVAATLKHFPGIGDVAVDTHHALGSVRNVEWLEGSGLAAGQWGVGCDAGCRAFDIHGVITDTVYVAGDVARAPHVLYEYQFLAMEHWDNAVLGAEVAAHNMVSFEPDYRPHLLLPGFWSGQFGVNIKSVGVPPFADEIVVTQGSVEDRRFVAAYGRRGRIVAAVTFNQGRWLEYYAGLIEKSAPFPPPPPGWDRPVDTTPMPAAFPAPGAAPTAMPEVVLTGHDPNERRAEFRPRRR